jgi:hypothetical protein
MARPASQLPTSVTGRVKTGSGSKPQRSSGTAALACDCPINLEHPTRFRLNMRSVLIGVTPPEGGTTSAKITAEAEPDSGSGLSGIAGTHRCHYGLSCGASTRMIPLGRGTRATGGDRVSPRRGRRDRGRGDSLETDQVVRLNKEGRVKVNACSGVFSHFMLEALSGQVDADGKGFVTVQDANRHVTSGVKLWASQNKVSQTLLYIAT